MARLKRLEPGLASLGARLDYLRPDYDLARRAREPWRRWYNTARWAHLRDECKRLARYTCVRCGFSSIDTSLLHADHKTPHRGDWALFHNPQNLQCLCHTCHNSAKQAEEAKERARARRG